MNFGEYLTRIEDLEEENKKLQEEIEQITILIEKIIKLLGIKKTKKNKLKEKKI